MIDKIVRRLNKITKYKFEFKPRGKILYIETEHGMKMEEFIIIRKEVKPFVNDIRITSKWE